MIGHFLRGEVHHGGEGAFGGKGFKGAPAHAGGVKHRHLIAARLERGLERERAAAVGVAERPDAVGRALVLVDPPYEAQEGEYPLIVAALREGLADGTIGRYVSDFPAVDLLGNPRVIAMPGSIAPRAASAYGPTFTATA